MDSNCKKYVVWNASETPLHFEVIHKKRYRKLHQGFLRHHGNHRNIFKVQDFWKGHKNLKKNVKASMRFFFRIVWPSHQLKGYNIHSTGRSKFRSKMKTKKVKDYCWVVLSWQTNDKKCKDKALVVPFHRITSQYS